MTIEQAVEELNKIKLRQGEDDDNDKEADHEDADRILLNVIADQRVWNAFGEIDKWYA